MEIEFTSGKYTYNYDKVSGSSSCFGQTDFSCFYSEAGRSFKFLFSKSTEYYTFMVWNSANATDTAVFDMDASCLFFDGLTRLLCGKPSFELVSDVNLNAALEIKMEDSKISCVSKCSGSHMEGVQIGTAFSRSELDSSDSGRAKKAAIHRLSEDLEKAFAPHLPAPSNNADGFVPR